MAVQGGPLRDVDIIGAPLDAVAAEPVGNLITIPTGTSRVEALNITNRFPTPPAAFGFLITPIIDFAFDRMDPVIGGTLIGVLLPEGDYLEPTRGQIWPRIG